MTEPEVVERDHYTEVIVRDYDTLDQTLSFKPADTPSKPVIVKFIESNGNARYIRPPKYHEDGLCGEPAREFIYDHETQKWETHAYCEMIAKHVIRVKPHGGYEYPVKIYNIKERDLKDDLFMRGLLFDEWEPYLMREKAK